MLYTDYLLYVHQHANYYDASIKIVVDSSTIILIDL